MISARSLGLAMPAKAIAFPGAKPDGLLSHLSRLPSVHLIVALDESAPEYANPSLDAMFYPGRPPSAGPTECDYNCVVQTSEQSMCKHAYMTTE